MKKLSLVVSLLCLAGAGSVLLGYFLPRATFSSSVESPETLKQLELLGDSALASKDVPVAALLLYGGHVLGAGYNTVVRDGNAGGHAEINAISSALRALGEEHFRHLDRDSLRFVTTFEPCAMCRGAIVGYNIRKVEILKLKSVFDLLQEDLKILRYYWKRIAVDGAALQDTLFRRHPDYHGG